MLSVLLQGTLTAAPVRRTSSKGSNFATAQLRCAGEDGESVFCSVITFAPEAVEALLALQKGDAVAITGEASLSTWQKDGEHRVGLRVTGTRVLTVYQASKRRKAAAGVEA